MRTYLPAVITRCPNQREKVDRLVAHCRNLDGTELVVIDDPNPLVPRTEEERAQVAASALHLALQKMKGKPFMWLETDSIPLKPRWLRAITDEYKNIGKPFLLPDMCEADPCDLSSGIGVYPAEGHYLIPRSFSENGWDKWLEKHMSPLIARSQLIQHSYGQYNDSGNVKEWWAFPRDKSILRPETMLFHKDGSQSLLDCFRDSPYVLDFDAAPVAKKRDGIEFKHSGDLGDIIAALPILRAMGGGHVVLHDDRGQPVGRGSRELIKGARYEAIKPLLEAQPYVFSVSWDDADRTEETPFRAILRPRFESLTERQARHVNMWPVDLSPWLTVPVVEPHNRIIIARSPRYHNPHGFPWREIAGTYRDKLLFIGLPDEHAAFERVAGRPVEHKPTRNFLEIAQVMAGASQVFANQSSPLWIAMGLGRKVIVEGFPHAPNSEIHRAGSFWAYEADDMHRLRISLENLHRG